MNTEKSSFLRSCHEVKLRRESATFCQVMLQVNKTAHFSIIIQIMFICIWKLLKTIQFKEDVLTAAY